MDTNNHKKIKTGKTLFKNKLILSLFALLFAGIGTYAIISGHADTPGYTRGNVLFHVMNSYNNSEGVQALIQFSPVGSTFPVDCDGTLVAKSGDGKSIYATSNSSGYVAANCAVSSQGATSKQYVINSIGSLEAGFTLNNGGYHVGNYVTIPVNGTVLANIYMDPPDGCGDRTKNNTCPPPPPATCPAGQTGTPPNCVTPTPSGCGSGTLNNQCASISSFIADSYTLANGSNTNLRWATSYATNCTLNGTKVAPFAGSNGKPAYPTGALNGNTSSTKNYTYTLACSGTNSNPSRSLVIAVGAPNQPPPPPPTCTSGCGGSSSGGGSTKKPSASSAAVANDTVAPSTPTNLSANQTDPGSIDLSWDASTDNIGVDHYVVERSEDNSTWNIVAPDVTNTSYTDADIVFNTHYYYRVSAVDVAGNKSGASLPADITSGSFTANVTADKDATITSDDKVVTARIPSGAVTEDAFCEIVQDTTRLAPKKLKLAAGSYQINCKNSTGDQISSFEKDASITMALKKFKSFGSFSAYTLNDSSLSAIAASFNKNDKTLKFSQSDLQPFAAYGQAKSHGILFWLLFPLILVGIVYGLLRYRNSRGGDGDTYYDTTGYVSMPPSVPVAPAGGGYEHHPTLPEMVAQGQQPLPPQQVPQYPQPQPVPPQYQDPNQPQPPQPA